MKKIYVKPYIIPIMLVNSSQKQKSKKKNQMQKYGIETSLNYIVHKIPLQAKIQTKKLIIKF